MSLLAVHLVAHASSKRRSHGPGLGRVNSMSYGICRQVRLRVGEGLAARKVGWTTPSTVPARFRSPIGIIVYDVEGHLLVGVPVDRDEGVDVLQMAVNSPTVAGSSFRSCPQRTLVADSGSWMYTWAFRGATQGSFCRGPWRWYSSPWSWKGYGRPPGTWRRRRRTRNSENETRSTTRVWRSSKLVGPVRTASSSRR